MVRWDGRWTVSVQVLLLMCTAEPDMPTLTLTETDHGGVAWQSFDTTPGRDARSVQMCARSASQLRRCTQTLSTTRSTESTVGRVENSVVPIDFWMETLPDDRSRGRDRNRGFIKLTPCRC